MIDFQEVSVQFEPLIRGQIKKLNLYRSYDEYYQLGLIALWEACQRFDPEKGAFEAFALHTVRGHMLMQLKREKRFSDRHFLGDDAMQAVESVVAIEPEDLQLFDDYLNHLSERERAWFIEAIVQGKKPAMIASEYQVSVNTVSTWRKNALKKLRVLVKQ
ncbi:sigma-70 family RNA polymerase sigma factor [Bacillus suaedae]|uniref:Sigma-70 family RNA polymerase sigma factor n=1 Tax=Halalkalibacter suaedae TaxID=2822140 RepID=A0A940X0Q9_9BACI|nr:sigma-70 family RNA polymerase sigma factor [Bacillus suaedae]